MLVETTAPPPEEGPFTKDRTGYIAARDYLERQLNMGAQLGLFETIELANAEHHKRHTGK